MWKNTFSTRIHKYRSFCCRAITDHARNIQNTYAYTPFGTITENEAFDQPFTFSGEYGVIQEPNGLYYMRARYYDPVIGRFISEDPIHFAGGDVNLYAYVGNNPINFVDPNGLWTLQLGISTTGGVGGGGTSGGGVVLGYSRESGFQIGIYSTIGAGGYGGLGGSLTFDVTGSGNKNIYDLFGGAGTIGGSVNLAASVGGEVNVPLDASKSPSYTFNIGSGLNLPVPVEEHAFYTQTSVLGLFPDLDSSSSK